MSAPRGWLEVTAREYDELMQLYSEMSKGSIASMTIDELEHFTDLFARTLSGKGDNHPTNN